MKFAASFDSLCDFEKDLITLAFGIDALTGADALHESGTQHFIIDTWTSGIKPPAIYNDEVAVELRKKGGISSFEDKKALGDYIKKYQLHDLSKKIRNSLKKVDKNRADYLFHIVDVFQVMLNILDENSTTRPSYDDKYRAVTGIEKAEIVDVSPYRKILQDFLQKAGFEVKTSGDLREKFLEWESASGYIGAGAGGRVDGEVVKHKFNDTIRKLLGAARERLLCKMDFGIKGYKPDLSDVAFDGFEFKPVSNVMFTGSSIYRGQGANDPKLEGLLEYNIDHPLTPSGLMHLVGHEAMIGHYFQSAVMDLLWRADILPFEATIGFMCTSDSYLHEGWAENALYTLYGSRDEMLKGIEKDFCINKHDMEITLAHSDLQNVAKHNVSIMHQKNGMAIDKVREYLKSECIMPDPLVKKLSGVWASEPLFGPMYGPAYYIGSTVVRKALKDVGAIRVAQVALQTTGRMCDLFTFKEQIWK